MNKIRYYYTTLAAVLTLGFSACTDEVEYHGASPVADDCPRISFTSNDDAWEVAPADEKSLTLTLTRENTEGEVTVPINVLRNDENMFQIPESVTFAAGQNTTTLTITFPNVVLAEIYTYSVGLNSSDVDPYSANTLASSTGTVQMIQWDLLGVGSLTNNVLYTTSITAPCNVYRASHAEWYKAEEPLEEGKDIIFKVDEKDNVLVEEQAIITHPSYGLVYVNNTDTGIGMIDRENNVIKVDLLYYCSAGQFGDAIETLTIPTTATE